MRNKSWQNLSADERIVRARSLLVMGQPFYGTLALYLKVEALAEIKTTATDGKHLFYNPAYLLDRTEDETVGLIAHEVSHCAYRHMARRGQRDHVRWNEACDYALNMDLIGAGFKMPDGILLDNRFRGKSAEEIYAILTTEAESKPQEPQSQPQPGQGGKPQAGQGSGGAAGEGGQPGGGEAGPSDGGTEPSAAGKRAAQQCGADHGGCCGVPDAAEDAGTTAQTEAEWDVRVRQAIGAAAAAGAGHLPAHLQRLADAVRKPTESWRDRLRDFIDQKGRSDFSWTTPNKRFMGRGFILPGQSPDSIHHLAVAIDTSGSISDYALQAFRAELQAALDDGAADEITVVYCDTAVNKIERYNAHDEVEFSAVGGGGTDFAPAFAWLAENVPEAAAIIFFTDLGCGSFGKPHAPVLWACQPGTSDAMKARVPFGECVQIN